MKNILIIVSFILFNSVKGQISLFQESGTKVYSLGLEYKTKSGYGAYIRYASNGIYKTLGMNTSSDFRAEGSYTSSVDWYGRNGTHYPVYRMDDWNFSKKMGNKIVDEGNVTNVVETWERTYKSTKRIGDMGFVFPCKKLTIRVGCGLYKETIVGNADYRRWEYKLNLYKMYDEWQVIAKSTNHFFVVSGTATTSEYESSVPVYEEIVKTNINIAIYYPISKSGGMGFGYDSNGGLNFGMNFFL
jgi:hypothetical protein